MANITMRIDDELKTNLQQLLSDLGMDITTYFTLAAKQAVMEQGMPFTPKVIGRIDSDKVAVNKFGDFVLLMPKANKWSSLMQAIDMFSDDFMQAGRDASPEQERE